MMKRIYVGNLPAPTTEHELTSLFRRVGPIISVLIMRDRDTGRPKGFGFVEMGEGEAEQAIRQLNRIELHGHALAVTEARPRPEASSSRSIPPSRLFVGNLPYEATATELQAFFSSVGPVSSVSLPVERESGKPRGFAFVDFADRAHAEEAVRRFHNQPFNGRALVINEARAREGSAFSPSPARSVPPSTGYPVAPRPEELPTRTGGPRRQFGPASAPQRGRQQTGRGPKPERGRGKPIRERKRGQFFGRVEDEPYEGEFPGAYDASQGGEPEGGE